VGIYIKHQAPGLQFNRGTLLNAGALLLAGSEYDCLVFHDVDTVCSAAEEVRHMHRDPASVQHQWIGSKRPVCMTA